MRRLFAWRVFLLLQPVLRPTFPGFQGSRSARRCICPTSPTLRSAAGWPVRIGLLHSYIFVSSFPHLFRHTFRVKFALIPHFRFSLSGPERIAEKPSRHLDGMGKRRRDAHLPNRIVLTFKIAKQSRDEYLEKFINSVSGYAGAPDSRCLERSYNALHVIFFSLFNFCLSLCAHFPPVDTRNRSAHLKRSDRLSDVR